MVKLLAPGSTASDLRVADLMQRHFFKVRPEASVRELVALLVYHGINSVVVVDRTGRAVGTASAADLLHFAAYESEVPVFFIPREQLIPGSGAGAADAAYDPQSHPHLLEPLLSKLRECMLDGHTVAEIMMPVTLSLPATASIAELAYCVLRTGADRVLVTEREKLVGVVSTTDLLHAVTRTGHSRSWEPDEPYKVVCER